MTFVVDDNDLPETVRKGVLVIIHVHIRGLGNGQQGAERRL